MDFAAGADVVQREYRWGGGRYLVTPVFEGSDGGEQHS